MPTSNTIVDDLVEVIVQSATQYIFDGFYIGRAPAAFPCNHFLEKWTLRNAFPLNDVRGTKGLSPGVFFLSARFTRAPKFFRGLCELPHDINLIIFNMLRATVTVTLQFAAGEGYPFLPPTWSLREARSNYAQASCQTCAALAVRRENATYTALHSSLAGDNQLNWSPVIGPTGAALRLLARVAQDVGAVLDDVHSC